MRDRMINSQGGEAAFEKGGDSEFDSRDNDTFKVLL